jgi:hypothetical protein
VAWSDGTLFEVHAERSPNCHRFCKTPSQQKHAVLLSTVPLQLKRFKVGSKMAISVSAPVLQNQKKKKSVAKSPDSLTQPLPAFVELLFTVNFKVKAETSSCILISQNSFCVKRIIAWFYCD